MGEKLENIEVKHSNINEFWLYFITFILLIFFCNFLFSIKHTDMHSISTYIKVLLGFNIGVLVFASIVFYWFLPLVRVRFCVSKEHFKFDLQNNLFLKVLWRDIELLEVIKVKWRCYKINYIKLNQTKTLRLFLLQFSRKKTILILKLLKEFAENTNVNFKEVKIEEYNSKDTWNDWIEIRKIIQSVKKLS